MEWPQCEAVLIPSDPAEKERQIAVFDVRFAVRFMAIRRAMKRYGRAPRERIEYRLIDRSP